MKAKQKKELFENQVRFNWGYHDAAQAVREGWDNRESNFGFCCVGPLANLSSVSDILKRHFDSAYAQGWQAGYNDAKDGMYEARGRNSREAWETAKRLGLVND